MINTPIIKKHTLMQYLIILMHILIALCKPETMGFTQLCLVLASLASASKKSYISIQAYNYRSLIWVSDNLISRLQRQLLQC